MSHNTFGHLFRVTTWGESHGPALGCVVDGCPPGLRLRGVPQAPVVALVANMVQGGGLAFSEVCACVRVRVWVCGWVWWW